MIARPFANHIWLATRFRHTRYRRSVAAMDEFLNNISHADPECEHLPETEENDNNFNTDLSICGEEDEEMEQK
ncbi:hypothetical protein TNCV_1766621 [Trichonephila clavipes]|nr:hypothetical protein TNCV_1766621 [Trichonephila clavipes]